MNRGDQQQPTGGGGAGVSWLCILGVLGLIFGILVVTRPGAAGSGEQPFFWQQPDLEWFGNRATMMKKIDPKKKLLAPKTKPAAAKPKPPAVPKPAAAGTAGRPVVAQQVRSRYVYPKKPAAKPPAGLQPVVVQAMP